MKQNERKLFKELCKFTSDTFDETVIDSASPHVLGYLFFNRMQAIAYGTLKKHKLLGKVSREFRNSLKAAHEQNVEKNRSFFQCVDYISNILCEYKGKVAMLKGAFLCAHYPDGYRTSNDIDLLVLPEDVTEIGKRLTDEGFKQGNIRNGVFVPASRREIIESKMMRGETVPYIKEVSLPFMKYLEVDINFSLDYKNGDNEILKNILERTCNVEQQGIHIPTLCKEDFFIHLCAHLYKEATTLPWIEMHRDMTLYKYCDIYMLLSEMTDMDVNRVFIRAKELGVEKICAYAVLEAVELFDMQSELAQALSKEILSKDLQFVLRVIDPKEKRELVYQTSDATKRFFMSNRAEDLKEIIQ